LRSLILRRVKNWDYRELRERINDGYTLRGFTDFDSHAVPKHDAFNRAFNRITPATLQAINQAVGLEEGKQLRVDTTVVQTDIHFPPMPPYCGTGVASATILTDQFSGGANIVQAFDALAHAGYTPDPGYGAGRRCALCEQR
jgi:hypothetical protein